MRLTGAVYYAQAAATAELMAGGILRLCGEHGETLGDGRMPDTYTVGDKGERIVWPRPHSIVCSAKGQACRFQILDKTGKIVLAEDFAGEHTGAVLRFEDSRLFERMIVDFEDEFFIIELINPEDQS